MDSFIQKWPFLQFLDANVRKKIKCLHVFGKHGNNYVFKTSDDQVYYIPSCKYSHRRCVKGNITFTPVLIESLCGKNVAGFTAGWDSYVVAYTESGELYSWGHKCYKELNYIYEGGILKDEESDNVVVQILKDHKIKKVACGAYHTVAVTDKGEVFFWGRIKECRGIDFKITTPRNPEKINGLLENKTIVDVACGKNFSIVIDEDFVVYGWGSNKKGQLANKKTHNYVKTPINIPMPNNKRILSIACGAAHTLALSTDGILFIWGCNMGYECGVPKYNGIVREPVQLLTKVHEIGASHGCKLSGAALGGYIHVWGTGKEDTIIKEVKKTKHMDMVDAFVTFTDSLVTPQNYVYGEEFPSMTDCIISLFNNRSESDITFKIGDQFLYMQKTLLMIRSHHFKTMLKGNWKESKYSVIDITEHSYEVYKTYLEYLYLDQVNEHLSWNFVAELLNLANSHDEETLVAICEERLETLLTPNNVSLIYNTALILQLEDLMDRCAVFASRHFNQILLSDEFKEMDENVANDFIEKVKVYDPLLNA